MTEEVNTIETKYLQHLEVNTAFKVYSALIYFLVHLDVRGYPFQGNIMCSWQLYHFFSNIVEYVQLVNSNLVQKANANGKVTWYT